MTFRKIGTVLTADELMDKAFSRASRAAKGKIREVTDRYALEESMVITAGNILADNFCFVLPQDMIGWGEIIGEPAGPRGRSVAPEQEPPSGG